MTTRTAPPILVLTRNIGLWVRFVALVAYPHVRSVRLRRTLRHFSLRACKNGTEEPPIITDQPNYMA